MNNDELAHAFKMGQSGHTGNAVTDGTEYRLHGHKIAWIDGKRLMGNWCGYATATTQRHLTNIAHEFSCDPASFGGLSRERGRVLGKDDFVMKEVAR